MKTHRHRAKRTSDALPFFGAVNPERPNEAAHGGCRFVATCACGAERETLVNGRHVERGRWIEPEESDR